MVITKWHEDMNNKLNFKYIFFKIMEIYKMWRTIN
jgi:hypothetical protein